MILFGKDEINLSRRFEFDFAKVVCILGMVFVHCFEELALGTTGNSDTFYYIMVIVLDSIFGAGTFMACMGLGITYSRKNSPDALIKRGIKIFLLGYVLNILRDGLPRTILCIIGKESFSSLPAFYLCDDIMQFAGLALLLFGLLRKLKLSDLALFLTALGMSVTGSFVRFLDLENDFANEIVGLFFGTYSNTNPDVEGCFPLFNWFIIVVLGYLYAKAIRRCKNINKYYAISLPVSAAVLAVYMIISIPNGLGMMNGNIYNYYHFTTPNTLILFTGTVFATGLYHFIGMLLSDKTKNVLTRISSNLNRIYCIHWVIIGWISTAFVLFDCDGLNDILVFIVGVVIFVAANVLAEIYARYTDKKKAIKK